jgi:ERCC4-related helicase
MAFLKQMNAMPHSMQPRYLSVMTVRNMTLKFQSDQENFSIAMAAAFY